MTTQIQSEEATPSEAAPSEAAAESVTAKGRSVPPRLRRVFCVGMRRGGSTLQLQIVRHLLTPLYGEPTTLLATPETIESVLPDAAIDRVHLIKCHKYLPCVEREIAAGRASGVGVFRDVRNVVASIVRKYDVPAFAYVHGGLQTLLDENAAWERVSGVYVGKYETMTADIAAEAKTLASQLGVPCSDEAAAAIADELSPDRQEQRIAETTDWAGQGDNAYDPKTLMHRNHTRSGGDSKAAELLSPAVVAALEHQAAGWLRSRGYELTHSAPIRLLAAAGFAARAAAHRVKTAAFGDSSPSEPTDREAT